MQNQRITTRTYSIDPDRPKYTLESIKELTMSVNFSFDSPNGKLTIKLPKLTRDKFGRRCDLDLVYFCEGIHELISAPVYWPAPNPSYIRAYHKRPQRG